MLMLGRRAARHGRTETGSLLSTLMGRRLADDDRTDQNILTTDDVLSSLPKGHIRVSQRKGIEPVERVRKNATIG